MRRLGYHAALAVLLSVALPAQGRAGIITLTPTMDTRLIAVYPNSANGGSAQLGVYHKQDNFGNNIQHTLIYFDLSSIPVGQVVTAASLELRVVAPWETNGSGTASPLYRLTQGWTESGASWNRYNGSTAWATPGGDFDALVVYASSVPPTGTLPLHGPVTWDATTLVQQWYAGTYINYGMLLDGAEGNTWHFSSREDTADGYAYVPQLSVTYSPAGSPVPEPATLTLLGLGLAGVARAARRRKK